MIGPRRRDRSGLVAGLGAASGERALVVGGDMPDLVPSVLSSMIARLGADVDAVALHDGERMRPLPCALRTGRSRAVGEALFEGGERSLRRLLEALDAEVIAASGWSVLDPQLRTLFDVDEPGDLGPTG